MSSSVCDGPGQVLLSFAESERETTSRVRKFKSGTRKLGDALWCLGQPAQHYSCTEEHLVLDIILPKQIESFANDWFLLQMLLHERRLELSKLSTSEP